MEQIMLNLLNNSLDSLTTKIEKEDGWGGLNSEIKIITRRVNELGKEWAQVSIYDTGEGIRKSDLHHVLKPFFTTKRPGEGTGLGLAICQELIQHYGGHLQIQSKEGTWTEVIFKIPYGD
jgi:two-component system NtrC family sensor kinase